jgi:hypothetical protein
VPHDIKRRLPIRVRPFHRETAANYLLRLVESNFLTEDKAALLVSAVRQSNPELSGVEAVERAAEWKGDWMRGSSGATGMRSHFILMAPRANVASPGSLTGTCVGFVL